MVAYLQSTFHSANNHARLQCCLSSLLQQTCRSRHITCRPLCGLCAKKKVISPPTIPPKKLHTDNTDIAPRALSPVHSDPQTKPQGCEKFQLLPS